MQLSLEKQIAVEEAAAGDIISIAGLDGAFVNHTICDLDVIDPLPVFFVFYFGIYSFDFCFHN